MDIFVGSLPFKLKEKELKELFYSEGAVYSSMSGSGSCVFGIFDQEPNLKSFEHYQSFLQKPNKYLLSNPNCLCNKPTVFYHRGPL